ncbi:MAG: AbrB/MazE/SpoVT family DNA-binding domain-containing protein [Alcanivoracaceae bacterium]|nr:AbrB/MazE/SpoVT family DNA-binding domain-containing protein [Alcanivoracaceae bacterium]
MPIASIFKNSNNQDEVLPKDHEGVAEEKVNCDGKSIVLTPIRRSWTSVEYCELAGNDFLCERQDTIEEGRVLL